VNDFLGDLEDHVETRNGDRDRSDHTERGLGIRGDDGRISASLRRGQRRHTKNARAGRKRFAFAGTNHTTGNELHGSGINQLFEELVHF